jgi:hypothetical protein
VIPFLILCIYAEPATDDYAYAVRLFTDSFLNIQIYEYLHWGSRYTATAILITDPIYFGWFWGYKLIALCMIVFFTIASFFMFHQLSNDRKLSSLLTAFFCFLYLFLVPDVYSAFYWLSGSATYHLGNILSLLFIGFLIKTTKSQSVFSKIALFILTFLIIGCNEISMVYLNIFIFSVVAYSYYTQKKINSLYFGLLLWAGVLTLFILLAPGNNVRSESAISHHITASESIVKVFRKMAVVVIRYGLLSFLLTLLVFYNLRKPLLKIKLNFLNLPFYFYIFLFIAFLFSGCFPSLWSLGAYPPLRTVNIIFLVILLFSIIFCYKLITLPVIFNSRLSEYFLSITLLLLIFSYIFVIGNKNILQLTNNLYHSYDDLLSGKVKEFKKEMKTRYTIIRNSKEDTIYVESLKSRPYTISESDLSKDPKHFYNQSMADFFNKKAIISK